ncbi:MAG TPA: hypothetical protein VGW38_24795 [Chloroflexota bacterium]|nr:hypothetical protein [Chloroflexota bacterium]
MVPQRYRRLLDVFAEVFGRDFIPVDSPKSLDALRTAVSVPELGVQVLHLIRDVRSWTISRLDTDTRQGDFTPRDLYRKHGSDAWRPLVLRNSYARFLVWHRGNHRIQKFMAERNLPVLRVGYEEFAAGSLTGMTVASLPRP